MPRYQFPNVPQVPGVPQVRRSPLFPNTTPPALGVGLALGRLVLAFTRKSGWGIYLDTTAEDAAELRAENDQRVAEGLDPLDHILTSTPPPVLVPDSFRDFGFRKEWAVTTAPTEQGGFASYNKVNNPHEVQLRLTKGGSLRDRTQFLEKIEQIANSLQLYKIVTPEKTYFRCNIFRYEVTRKEASGAYWLPEVDIFFTEIRTVQSEYTNTTFDTANAKQSSATPLKNGGTRQPQAAVPDATIPVQ